VSGGDRTGWGLYCTVLYCTVLYWAWLLGRIKGWIHKPGEPVGIGLQPPIAASLRGHPAVVDHDVLVAQLPPAVLRQPVSHVPEKLLTLDGVDGETGRQTGRQADRQTASVPDRSRLILRALGVRIIRVGGCCIHDIGSVQNYF